MAAGPYRLPLAALLAALAMAQPAIDLSEIGRRERPTFAPARLGEKVAVEGVVSTRAINFGEYAHLAIQDINGVGVYLERQRGELDKFTPGDVVRANGSVSIRAGMPVVGVDSISKVGSQAPPLPQRLRLSDMMRFENIGRYVQIESFVITNGQNAGGDILIIGSGAGPTVTVFYPRYKRWEGPGLLNFNPGDKVRVVGLGSQYCPVEPFDRGWQILVDNTTQVTVLERGWMIPPSIVLYLLLMLISFFVLWWAREHGMADQRRTIRGMMALSEEVLGASNVTEMARRVQQVLPGLLHGKSVDLFLHNRRANTLDRIPSEAAPEPLSIPIENSEGPFHTAAALCFRNRALLNVPDFRKSPLVEHSDKFDVPDSAVFVPMVAQGEALGLVAVHFKKRNRSNRNQQAALQHLANQIAASLKLQEQHSIREQLLRSEKMAAAGQLISAVAYDLRAPLNEIRSSAERLYRLRGGPEELQITAETDRGLQIVNHLLAFARMERAEARAINLHHLVSNIVDVREPEWQRKHIALENTLPLSPVEVFADESELEQVILSLLVHVEHALEQHPGRTARMSSRVLGNRVQISIDFSGTMENYFDDHSSGDSFSLRVCQAIAQSHGGDIRLFETQRGSQRYELELPVHHAPFGPEPVSEPSRRASRVLTTILIEPDAQTQRRLLALLSVRGHRAIPVDNADEAADMVQRLTFDVVFCTVRLPGLSWTEFYRRVRRRIVAFVLLAEDYDADNTGTLKEGVGFVLRKPIEEAELDNVLVEVESRHNAARQ